MYGGYTKARMISTTTNTEVSKTTQTPAAAAIQIPGVLYYYIMMICTVSSLFLVFSYGILTGDYLYWPTSVSRASFEGASQKLFSYLNTICVGFAFHGVLAYYASSERKRSDVMAAFFGTAALISLSLTGTIPTTIEDCAQQRMHVLLASMFILFSIVFQAFVLAAMLKHKNYSFIMLCYRFIACYASITLVFVYVALDALKVPRNAMYEWFAVYAILMFYASLYSEMKKAKVVVLIESKTD